MNVYKPGFSALVATGARCQSLPFIYKQPLNKVRELLAGMGNLPPIMLDLAKPQPNLNRNLKIVPNLAFYP